MTYMTKSLAALLSLVLVAGCDGDEAVVDGEEIGAIEAEFGSAFAAALAADPNAEPVDAQNINLAVDGTADPINP